MSEGDFEDQETFSRPDLNERREEERVGTSLRVDYESFDEFVVAYAADISQGGLFVQAEDLLPEGSVVRLLLKLPEDGPTLKIIARVAHLETSAKRTGMGMEFLNVEGLPLSEQLSGYLTLRMADGVAPGSDSPAKIVVVDDDAAFRHQAVTVMEKAGHSVQIAHNGLEALGLILRDPPDLILADVEMPTMDGWQLLRMVRARPGLCHVPIIFMTKLSTEEERLKGYRLGVDDYIPKPFLFEELTVRVSRALTRAATRRPTGPRNALRGDLAQVSLVSVLQFVEIERRTGLLLIVDGERLATLHIRDGSVVAVDTGGLSDVIGVERLYEVLDWSEGRFELTSADVDIEDSIGESTSYVLLEYSRRKDEHGHK